MAARSHSIQQITWALVLSLLGVGGVAVAAKDPPAISDLVKPKILERAVKEREVMTHASLDSIKDAPIKDLQEYSYYALMLVHANTAETKRILTDYRLYSEMVPYIDKADYHPSTQNLDLEGGIWKFRLRSSVHFHEVGPRWIQYQIVSGHFAGLAGDIFFEDRGDQGTLAMLRGSQKGTHFPPAFVIERGAEIVFGFTAKRMRSYIETHQKTAQNTGEKEPKPNETATQVPQPRRRL
jgi:hypothetical protein